jgi:aminoglycoside phosphotransferase (APT) family kinase protein
MIPPDPAPLAAWLRDMFGANLVTVESLAPLSGGSIQQNIAVDAVVEGGPWHGRQALVARRDAPATISASLSRRDEFAVLKAAHDAGVTVPRPVGFCDDPAVLGGPFSVVARVAGTAFGPKVVKDQTLGGDREALGHRLGMELARLHAVTPPRPDLACLGDAPAAPAPAMVARLRTALDAMGLARPELEWGLRFVETQAPAPRAIVLCHNDFRTGNYLVDSHGLTAVLDWEFAGWGDPMADLGWFCARCWRFSRPDREAGGMASRAAFYAGYTAGGGRVDDDAVRFWEVAAHLRWGVIALEQGERHLSGRERSLELALTGRLAAELEWAALAMTAPERWSRA